MAAQAGEAEAEAELRSGAPGAWAEQAPRSSQHQGEPLAAAPHPILGTLSLDGPHNGHTWTPTQGWTLAAPSGIATHECPLHTSPKSPTQEGGLHSTPESLTQGGPLHAPTETLVNQEPLHTPHGWPLTQEGLATMKALPLSCTHNSPLHSNSPQDGQFHVLPATVDHEVATYQIRFPETCPSTAVGQGHVAETTSHQGPLQTCPLTPADEASLCELSDQQHPLHLHHDTSQEPEKLEGHLTVCYLSQVGSPCKPSEAAVHQDLIIDHLGTPMKQEKGQSSASAEGLSSEGSLPDCSETSLLEGKKTLAIPTEQLAKEGSIHEISQIPIQEVAILHHVPLMALSQRESSNATVDSLALNRLTTPKGPLAPMTLDQTGSLNKAQSLEDSSLYGVPSLADSHSAVEPSPPQDTFARVPSLVDGLIDHLPLDGQTSSLDCPLSPSLDSSESSSALHGSNFDVVSSLHSTITLPMGGTETGSATSTGDPIAFSCINSVEELTPLDSVVTSSHDVPCGKTFMLVDRQVSDCSPALNRTAEEGLFPVACPVDSSTDPLSKIFSPENSLTKVPSFLLDLPNADTPAVVCSETNNSSFLVDVNTEGTLPVDADTKGPYPRDPKGLFAVPVDVKGPFPVDIESADPFPGIRGVPLPVEVQTQSLFPLDSHGDGTFPLDVKAPVPSLSHLEVHSEVKSSIPTDVDVEGGYTVNVKVEAPFQVNIVTHSSTLSPPSLPPLMHDHVSGVPDVLMSKMTPPLEVPPGKALSNVAVIETSASVASVEVMAEFALIDGTSGNASDADWVEGTSWASKPRGTLFVAEVERPSEVVRLGESTAACQAKGPLVVAQVLSPSPGKCPPSRLSFKVSPSQVPLPVGLLQVSSEVPLKIVPSKISSANDQVSLEVAPCRQPSEVDIMPSQFTSSQGSLVPAQSMVPSEAVFSRAPLEVVSAPLEISPSSASAFTLVHSSSKYSQGQSSTEDAQHQTSLPLEAPVASPKSTLAKVPLAMEQKQVPLPTTFSLEEVLLPMDTPMLSTEVLLPVDTPMLSTDALLVQPSISLHNTLIESPIHNMSLPTTLELPVSARVTSPMSGLQLSQDGLMVKTSLPNNQLLSQGGVSKHEEPLVKAGFNQMEPLLSRNISLPASPFLQDGLLTGLNPGSEVRVTLDHIIEDALVVSFRLGERIFSGVLMDISKRFGPHGIPVTVIPKREYKNTQSSIQPQVKSFHEEIMANCEAKVLSETPPSPVQNLEPNRIQSVWTSNPPPLFHEGAPYPPPLFIRDTYNQSIPQPPPRKIRRPKRKLFREEPTSIMNAIKLRPRQVLCDKCKNSVVTDKKEIKRGLSASEDSRKRRHESLTTVSKKLKTHHNMDSKGQTESQKRNAVVKETNLAHGRSRVVRVPTRSNSPKSLLNTKKVLQTKNIEQVKAREVLKMAKEKAQKHMDTPGVKNTHARVQVTRRFTNPSSGTLPPRLRLKPQRYRNEENDSSLKTRLEAMRSSKLMMKPQPGHITTRSSGEVLPEMQSPPKGPDETNLEVQEMEVFAPPAEQEDPESLDKSGSKSNITVYMTLNQEQPGSSSASVCSSEGTDDLKSSHSECSSTENFDFPPGSMHTPPSSSSSSSLKEEKKPNNELKIKMFSKNVSKCIGADGRTICSGDIVWAKIYGFPWWPARILNMTVSRKDNGLLVRQEARISWFGSPTTSFVAVSQLAPFLDNFQLRFNKKRKGLYRKAITEAAKAAKQLTPEVRALLTQFET